MNFKNKVKALLEEQNQEKVIKSMFQKTLLILSKYFYNLNEESSLQKTGSKKISTVDKRKMLKNTYKQVLKKMGQEDNISVFMKLIDSVPESYLDYELKINTEKAGDFVNDLIKGKGKIATNELGNIINVVKGIGVPAITEYASNKAKLGKKTGEFGAKAINKNVDDYLNSKKDRLDPKNKLSAPAPKMLPGTTLPEIQSKDLTTIQKSLVPYLFGNGILKLDGKLGNIAKQIKSQRPTFQKRMPELSKVFKFANNFKEANKIAKENGLNLEFKNNNEFVEMLKKIQNSKTAQKIGVKQNESKK